MRVLLVDDHAPVRKGLRQLLELRPDVEVVGEGANGREAVERVEQLTPDVVLMDMNMPVMNGAEATRLIKERHPDVQVLALTAFGDMELVAAMVKAGASGYLLKGGSSDELVQSLQAVARGEGALDQEITRGVMDDMAKLYKREQERAQALAELDRMKTEFVSVVTHELRSPLTAIKGSVMTLQRGWKALEDQEKRDFLDSVARQCDRLDRMVNQILTVSGIQRGGLGLAPETFSLAKVAGRAAEVLQHKAQGRLRLELADVEASGDPGRIKDVAVSLIENALVFTPGRVVVRVARMDNRPTLQVEDEGPGLDKQTLWRLLEEPFGQADSSMTRKVGGLGLSLYIGKQVLQSLGGRLEIETGPERGSTFTMVLPNPAVSASVTPLPRRRAAAND
jgi:signal transduction histidine kinase